MLFFRFLAEKQHLLFPLKFDMFVVEFLNKEMLSQWNILKFAIKF